MSPDPGAGSTSINVMFVDGSTDPTWQKTQQWYDSKTAEFNTLFPAISVELSHVPHEEMVTLAEEDLQHGTNQYHGYLVPLLNFFGGTSRLSDGLMDMSAFTVNNVNNIQWNTIGQFFRSHSALYEGKVLTLPLSGDFVSLYYRRDLFEAYRADGAADPGGVCRGFAGVQQHGSQRRRRA